MLKFMEEPFWVGQPSIRLEAGGEKGGNPGTVQLQLLPFRPGTYRCSLVLLNAQVGEFVVEVVATVELPKPLESFALAVQSDDDGTATQRLLKMPAKNVGLESACAALLERLPAAGRAKGGRSSRS